MLNERILSSLPNAGSSVSSATVQTQLVQWVSSDIESLSAVLWEFLYNPSQIQYSVSAQYAELAGQGIQTPHQQYQYSSGKLLTLTDLLLDGWWRGKVVQPLVDQLASLMRASDSGSPPILSLVMAGRTVIAPCVLTRVSVTETAWASSGASTVATVSLTLQEIHNDSLDTGIALQQTPSLETDRPIFPLTDRQQDDAEQEATAWLNANVSSLTPLIQNQLNTQDLRFSVDPELGDVSLLDATGGLLQKVGRWDGRNFKSADG